MRRNVIKMGHIRLCGHIGVLSTNRFVPRESHRIVRFVNSEYKRLNVIKVGHIRRLGQIGVQQVMTVFDSFVACTKIVYYSYNMEVWTSPF